MVRDLPKSRPKGRLRAGVVGVGYWGRLHALKYAAIKDIDLVALADLDLHRSRQVAAETGALAVGDHRDLIGTTDMVSIATPAAAHFTVARDFLEAGTHVLVEKPVATSVEQMDALIEIANRRGCLLQPGHIERFNPAWRLVRPNIHRPLLIESERLARPAGRSRDVSVVLDLMIHDLDLVLSVVDSAPAVVSADGARALSDGADSCHARVEFHNGCVAAVTASRVGTAAVRRMRLFQQDECLSVDFHGCHVQICRPQPLATVPFGIEQFDLPRGDALMSEIQAFVTAVRCGTAALVSADDGRRALALSAEIDRLAQTSILAAAG